MDLLGLGGCCCQVLFWPLVLESSVYKKTPARRGGVGRRCVSALLPMHACDTQRAGCMNLSRVPNARCARAHYQRLERQL
eukprot:2984306-Lingulodinium_polyedra.AAC.1